MAFLKTIRLEALIACQRQCCLCNERKHTRMQCHHIIQEADSGPDTHENCIPLCPDCHAEVQAFNPRHPFGGTPYDPDELRRRRDDWYSAVANRSKALAANLHRSPLKYPHSRTTQGKVSFNYTHHDGFCRLGQGDHEFLSHWSRGSDTSIYCYSDGTNVSVALARKGAELRDIDKASHLHFGSRVQMPLLNQIVVLENHVGRYAALNCNCKTLRANMMKIFWFSSTGFSKTGARISRMQPNPSLQPTCYGWLRQPTQAAELKR